MLRALLPMAWRAVVTPLPPPLSIPICSFNPKHTLNYTWSSTGGQITGKDNAASLTTDGVAGGSYTVTAPIVDSDLQLQSQAHAELHLEQHRRPNYGQG